MLLPKSGFEPLTHGFSIHCSTPELFRHMKGYEQTTLSDKIKKCTGRIIQLS